MHWIVSNNMFNEEGFSRLLAAFERLDVAHTLVKTIPFTENLFPEICDCTCHYRPVMHVEACCHGDVETLTDSRVVVMGTYTLCNIARKRKWRPGSFHDDATFRYDVQNEHWPMLNEQFRGGKLANVPEELFYKPLFVRPVHDTKSFVGQVMDWQQFKDFRDGVLALRPEDQPTITGDTLVIVSPRKEIYRETRVWMVDGRAVTASQYKEGTIKRYLERLPDCDEARFIEKQAKRWQPARAYVADVADTPDGLKVIEVNNLNAAGFYAADMQRLVAAIEDMR